MSLTIKKLTSFLLFLVALLMGVGSASAQDYGRVYAQREPTPCETALTEARNLYYNSQFEYVPAGLQDCIDAFNANTDYYKYDTYGLNKVFQVYKLIINSYYQTSYDDYASQKEDELIEYLAGVMDDPDIVLRRLDETEF